MKSIANCLINRLGELQAETGQTMSEYGIVLAFVCTSCAFVFTGFGSAVANLITNVARLLP